MRNTLFVLLGLLFLASFSSAANYYNTSWANNTRLHLNGALPEDNWNTNITLFNMSLGCHFANLSDARCFWCNSSSYCEPRYCGPLNLTGTTPTFFINATNKTGGTTSISCGKATATDAEPWQNLSKVFLYFSHFDNCSSVLGDWNATTPGTYNCNNSNLNITAAAAEWFSIKTFGTNTETVALRYSLAPNNANYWGLRAAPGYSDEAWFTYQYSGITREYRNSVAGGGAAVGGTYSSAWQEQHTVRNGTAHVQTWLGGTLVLTDATNVPSSSMPYKFMLDGAASGALVHDYLYVAKWANITKPYFQQSEMNENADPKIYANVSLAAAFETANASFVVNITSTNGNFSAFNITVFYNNTFIYGENWSGANSTIYLLNLSVTSPLVAANATAIPYAVYVNATVNGTFFSQANASGTQEVLLAYTFDTATFTKGSAYTVEAANTVTVATPPKPASADWPANVTGSAWMQGCNQTNGTGYAVNNTCPSGMLTLSGGFNFTLSPTHTSNSGIVHVDYLVNQSWNVTFNMTAESTSSKRLNRAWNASRDYIVWLVNESNQSINGAGNINTTLNMTFYDESNNTNISIENMLATFTVRFTDGTFKNFTVSYTGMFGEGRVRGHPAFYTANVSSFEVYSKTGYTTRSRFMVQAPTYLGTRQDVKVYMLEEGKADYLIINVVDSGNAVVGAYVQILKYYGAGTYLNVEQKITNVNGQAGAYLELDAYYKFAVYDSTGGQLYMSANPEQFVCVSGTCSITIDISGSSPLYFMTPYYSASCYGINATESIAFNFADQTGNTHNVRFRAWRSTNITGLGNAAVCDYTVSASSASYVCTLAPPENFTKYAYTCAVDIVASPPVRVAAMTIDFRALRAIADWAIVAIVLIMGLAGVAVHPAAGMLLVGMLTTGMWYLQIVEFNQGAMVMILMTAFAGAFLMLRDD